MKKTLLFLICCILLLTTACKNEPTPAHPTQNKPTILQTTTPESQYLRINVSGDTLGEDLKNHINANTSVIISAKTNFPAQLPIYEITKRNITEQEFQQLNEQLVVPESTSSRHGLKLEGNSVYGQFADRGTGTFTMTDDQLEALAHETLSQIPFLEGEYIYYGICGNETLEDSDGVRTTRVCVSFCRVLDGMRIIANDRCNLWFNDSGLVGITIDLFNYTKIGNMDVISPEEAEAKITSPDAFTLEAESAITSAANMLNVDKVTTVWVNQQSRGCTILQPLYIYSGTATFEDGTNADFSAEVIAIPESYTYEEAE